MEDRIAAVFKAIQLVEANLETDVAVADMAEAAGYSLFHFIRIFNQVVQHTPYDYLMRRRLSEAALCLRECDRRIIDVAQDFFFNNQEGFSRAFKRMFHLQPSRCRGKDFPVALLMPAINMDDLAFMNREDCSRPMITDLEDQRFIGLMTLLDQENGRREQQKAEITASLLSYKLEKESALQGAITTGRRGTRKDIFYFLGYCRESNAASTNSQTVLPPFVIQTLPGRQYVRLRILDGECALALKYLMHTWMPRSQFSAEENIYVELWRLESGRQKTYEVLVPVKTEGKFDGNIS